jgi:phosphonopyruvate decarboxylase
MIESKKFIQKLNNTGIEFFTGVPDSLLKDFCAYIDDHGEPGKHIITANEGNAIGLAAGYHLATNKIAAVYMQNSGLGNAVNPLTSLVDKEVYKIPMLLIIGWRGEPGFKDEPQHVKQGRVTLSQLNLLEIPYQLLQSNSNLDSVIDELVNTALQTNAPVALVVKKGAFASYTSKRVQSKLSDMKREDALDDLLGLIGDASIVSTTGKTSREVYELRTRRGEIQRDFLTVGAMGHTGSIALGVALASPTKRVVCIDGDGSLLMHLGSMPVIASLKPKNLIHVLLNNQSHESVGGQLTVAGQMDFALISKGCGYTTYEVADDTETLKQAWSNLKDKDGPCLLEIRISIGSRDDLGRPASTPEENKLSFMAWNNN